MDNFQDEAKLLIAIVKGEHGASCIEAVRDAGAPGCTKTRVWSLVSQPGTSGETWIPGEALFILLNSSQACAVVQAVKMAAATGFAATVLLIDASGGAANKKEPDGKADMESSIKLIATIVNHGHTDEIMLAARQAGAKGGTVVNARGTGTEEDAMFFGISLAPEKDMLLILAEAGTAPEIIRAIKSQPVLCEPGGGIVFTIGVEQAFFCDL